MDKFGVRILKERVADSLLMITKILSRNNQFKSNGRDFQSLYKRYIDPVRILIIGEFKSGKSTIINTLLQEDILKEGIAPTTAVTTYLRYAPSPYIEKVYLDGSVEKGTLAEIDSLTAEQDQSFKEIRLKLQHVNIYTPNENLKDIVLIDSPGLGAVYEEHTEQTLRAIAEADDAFWIFMYGAVGRQSEVNMLDRIKENGIHPIGVINKIDEFEVDEEDDDDEVERKINDYLEYEFNRLGNRIRKIIGISAMDAREALATKDDELYEISRFKELVQAISEISQNKQNKTQKFLKALYPKWNLMIDQLEKVINSYDYKTSVKKINEFVKDFREEHRIYMKRMLEERQLIVKKLVKLKAFLSNHIQLEKWLNNPVSKELENKIPQFKQWRELLKQHKNLQYKLFSYEREVKDFEILEREYLGSGFGRIKGQIKTSTSILRRIKQRRKSLLNKYKNLINEVQLMNEKVKQMQIDIEEKTSTIVQIYHNYQNQLEQDYNKIFTNYQSEKLGNLGAVRTVHSFVDRWNYLIELLDPIKNICEEIPGLRKPSYFTEEKNNVLHQKHLKKAEKDINAIINNYKLEEIEWFDFENFTQKILSPKPIELPSKPRYIFTMNVRPILASVAIATIIWGYHALDIKVRVASIFSTIGEQWERLATKEVDSNYVDDNSLQDEELGEYIQGNINSIASFYYDGNRLPVYNKVSNDAEQIAYITSGNYLVSHFTENGWMKIGEDAWVQYTDDFDLNQHYLNQALMPPSDSVFKTLETTSSFIPVFEDSSRKSPVIGFIEHESSLDVYKIPNGEWAQIGHNAWIEIGKYLSIDWQYVQNSNESPVGYVVVDANVLNVRSEDNKEGSIVGIVKKGETLEVYDYSDETGWYRVGDHAWVSNNYTTYTSLSEQTPVAVELLEYTLVYVEPDDSSPLWAAYDAGVYFNIIELFTDENETTWLRIGENRWIRQTNNMNLHY